MDYEDDYQRWMQAQQPQTSEHGAQQSPFAGLGGLIGTLGRGYMAYKNGARNMSGLLGGEPMGDSNAQVAQAGKSATAQNRQMSAAEARQRWAQMLAAQGLPTNLQPGDYRAEAAGLSLGEQYELWLAMRGGRK
jgi:hypothetical protein